jgi:hypothetical protein
MELKKNRKKKLKRLCNLDEHGDVVKNLITVDNYKRLKHILKSLDIKPLKNGKNFSYREYCKFFEAYLFKTRCNDGICCQAITKNGFRCRCKASNYTNYDLTNIDPTVPTFVKNFIGPKKTQKLKLLGFAKLCCFYCWQHGTELMVEYTIEGLGILNSFFYYATHREKIYQIFFKEVKSRKLFGQISLTVAVKMSDIRPYDEIIKYLSQTYGDTQGKLSIYYWVITGIVFSYDRVKPILMDNLAGNEYEKEEILENIAIQSANVILSMDEGEIANEQ